MNEIMASVYKMYDTAFMLALVGMFSCMVLAVCNFIILIQSWHIDVIEQKKKGKADV